MDDGAKPRPMDTLRCPPGRPKWPTRRSAREESGEILDKALARRP